MSTLSSFRRKAFTWAVIGCASVFWACTAEPEPETSGGSVSTEFVESMLQAPFDTVVTDDSMVVNIKDAKIGDGFVALVDGGTHQVVVIPDGGGVPQTVGRTGEGVGEYVRPNKLAFADDRLMVLDERLHRISRYERDASTEQWGTVVSKTQSLSMKDFCVDENGSVWVFAVDGADAVHKMSPDLEQVSLSLSGGFDPDDAPSLERAYRGGSVLCHAGLLVSGFGADNKIRVYDGNDGAQLRELVFPEISPVEIALGTVNGVTQVTTRFGKGAAYDERGTYSDHLRSLFVLDGNLVAQYVRGFGKARDSVYVASIIVDMETWGHELTEALPLVMDVRGRHFLTFTEKPVPLLRLHRFGE